jgi:hypothetical protein
MDILRTISDFYFLDLFTKKLLYAYTMNTLNGDISTKSMNISVNNNTNNIFFLSFQTTYTIWDGFSQKTISRYCPLKHVDSSRLCPVLSFAAVLKKNKKFYSIFCPFV